MRAKNKAVFIDRDGTLIKDLHYLSDPNKIFFYRKSFHAVRLLKKAGYKVIVLTNQSGIARSFFSNAVLEAIHKKMIILLTKKDAYIDKIYICPHLPSARCGCRKPEIGLVKKAQRDFNIDLKKSFMIGDKRADVYLGNNFGGKSILVLTGKGKKEVKHIRPFVLSHVARNLYDAARWIITLRLK